MPDRKQDDLANFVPDQRADSEAFTDDWDVATSFDEEQRKLNPERRQQLLEQAGNYELPMDDAAITAGDVDADLVDAETVGESAPGGGNPTPDQAMVEEIGRAVGLEYHDAEPLGISDKLEKRDRNRWELDPASSEDFKERRRDMT